MECYSLFEIVLIVLWVNLLIAVLLRTWRIVEECLERRLDPTKNIGVSRVSTEETLC